MFRTQSQARTMSIPTPTEVNLKPNNLLPQAKTRSVSGQIHLKPDVLGPPAKRTNTRRKAR
eukprot:6599397-Lingulodinium_polyedra.AAC.1